MSKEVTVKLWPIKKLQELPRSVYNQWAMRYRSFLQHRFVRYSRGGGNWPPLKRKRKRGAREKAAILRDTNTLFHVLDPAFKGNPGQLQKEISFGVRVGFGGTENHLKAGMTVARLAEIHHFGEGHMPERQIIVDPNDEVQRGMAADVERYWKKVLG